jgi:hypothetical protein
MATTETLMPSQAAKEARLAYCAVSRVALLTLSTGLAMACRRLALPLTIAERVVAIVTGVFGQRKSKEFSGQLLFEWCRGI